MSSQIPSNDSASQIELGEQIYLKLTFNVQRSSLEIPPESSHIGFVFFQSCITSSPNSCPLDHARNLHRSVCSKLSISVTFGYLVCFISVLLLQTLRQELSEHQVSGLQNSYTHVVLCELNIICSAPTR